MKPKKQRLEAIKMIVSGREISSQGELLDELMRQGFASTQATLSRDLKELKVAKASNIQGRYVYVLPNNIMYKRTNELDLREMLLTSGFMSLHFSGNLAVIRTRPGYASSIAYDIDKHEIADILGTIAGDDTILIVLSEGASQERVHSFLSHLIPNL
ncbi:MAG: arginine repressor [Prevotellaceae bacterium]|jgi:transcriptional regulator of arginine metabolism|nr:arginine repressor [Prevotellaceae bacterium]